LSNDRNRRTPPDDRITLYFTERERALISWFRKNGLTEADAKDAAQAQGADESRR